VPVPVRRAGSPSRFAPRAGFGACPGSPSRFASGCAGSCLSRFARLPPPGSPRFAPGLGACPGSPLGAAECLSRFAGFGACPGSPVRVRCLSRFAPRFAPPAEPEAREALELFCYRARKHLGALATVLGGVDRLVFTGGIGEGAPAVRERICAPLGWLGIALDSDHNAAGERVISSAASRVVVQVIAADEESVIARHSVRLLAAAGD